MGKGKPLKIHLVAWFWLGFVNGDVVEASFQSWFRKFSQGLSTPSELILGRVFHNDFNAMDVVGIREVLIYPV